MFNKKDRPPDSMFITHNSALIASLAKVLKVDAKELHEAYLDELRNNTFTNKMLEVAEKDIK